MARIPPGPSKEIQDILSQSDVWNTQLSYTEIDQSYFSRRWEYSVKRLRERDKKEVITAVALPVVAALASFLFLGTGGWDSVLKALGVGFLTLVGTLVAIFLLYWLSAPREIDEALRGDLIATQNQLEEEKRKLVRVATIAEEIEQRYLELTSRPTPPPAPERWLEELKRTHDLISLQPNIVHPYQGNIVDAHLTQDGTVVEGPSTDNSVENVRVVIAPYQNSPDTRPKRRIVAVAGVIGELTLSDFEEKKSSLKLNQGAWLSEKDIKTNFGVTDRRNLIVAAIRETGKERKPILAAVRREFNSVHPNGHTFFEQLAGDVFAVRIRLIRETDGSLLDDYGMMLEIAREPELMVRLMDAISWKSEHLHKFVIEGFAFSMKLHEIWKEANDQFPPKERQVFSFADAVSKAGTDHTGDLARIAAMEREGEEKLFKSIKDWESRAIEWVGRFISPEARETLIKSGPSLEAGLNRERKSAMQLLGPPRRPDKKAASPAPPPLPYWTLSDAVRLRTDALTKILDRLP